MLSPFSKRAKEKETRCFGANFLQPNAIGPRKYFTYLDPKSVKGPNHLIADETARLVTRKGQVRAT